MSHNDGMKRAGKDRGKREGSNEGIRDPPLARGGVERAALFLVSRERIRAAS